mgnify:CR=1 FL=1
MNNTRWTTAHTIIIGLLVCVSIVTLIVAQRTATIDGLLHVYFLDIGQGDAMLIQTPSGNHVLIDGGPDDSVMRELADVMPLQEHVLTAVVSTHTDADHVTGLVPVLGYYDVGTILETGMVCSTITCGRWYAAEKVEGAQRIVAHRGEVIQLGDGVTVRVLFPMVNEDGVLLKKTNDGGIVLKLTYASESVLFMADISQDVERQLLAHPAELKSDFLKVGHHGSKYSSTAAFLAAVAPQAAFIEVGSQNRYGHPTPETLQRLENLDIPYYRTDINGRIELILDGATYAIKPQYSN